MHRYLTLFLLLEMGLFCTFVYAEVCPPIKAIRSMQLNGWRAYDSDDHTMLGEARLSHFRKSVAEFALAEWSNKKSVIHCFYRDPSGSNLNIYLAKKNFIPDNTTHHWYKVSHFKQCAVSSERCQFTRISERKYLARR